MGRLHVLLLLPFVSFASLTAHAQAPTALQPNAPPVERTLGQGQTHEFTIILEENAWIQFVVEQQGIDVVVRVFAPDGRNIGEFDTPNGNDGPEHVSFVGKAAGVYRFTVSALNPSDSTSGRYQVKILELRHATDQEIKDSQNVEVVKAKGIALLLDLDEAITQIRSPFTRINAQLLVGQLLSEPEPTHASKYLTDAANGVKELIASVDGTDPNYSQQFAWISQLRFEVTRVLSQQDPEAALSFLYATVPAPNPYSTPREQASQEGMMELSITNQIMQKDPNRALQLARKSLKTRLSTNLMGTLGILSRKDPELAAQLANEMASKVLEQKLLKNPEAAGVAIGLLRVAGRFDRRSNANNVGSPKAGALLTDTQYRDLLQKVVTEALSFSPASSQAYNPERDTALSLLNGLQQIGPLDLNMVTPGGTAAVEKKLNELVGQRAAGPYQSQYSVANTPVDTALETIDKAPQEQREQLYLQLANREASGGDVSRARQIINEHISNPSQRRNSLANVDQQEIYRALGKGKVDDALRIISGFRTPKERASMLAQIAGQIGPGQKRANAINFLEQARALLGPSVQAQDQEQMNALFEISRAFSRYDSKRAFEIVEPLMDQINQICDAARTLEGFGANNFNDDELDVQNGGGSVAQQVLRMSQVLGTLAVTNFERAKADADRLRLPEVRLNAYLDIAQQSINGPVR